MELLFFLHLSWKFQFFERMCLPFTFQFGFGQQSWTKYRMLINHKEHWQLLELFINNNHIWRKAPSTSLSSNFLCSSILYPQVEQSRDHKIQEHKICRCSGLQAPLLFISIPLQPKLELSLRNLRNENFVGFLYYLVYYWSLRLNCWFN